MTILDLPLLTHESGLEDCLDTEVLCVLLIRNIWGAWEGASSAGEPPYATPFDEWVIFSTCEIWYDQQQSKEPHVTKIAQFDLNELSNTLNFYPILPLLDNPRLSKIFCISF
jgi:hypothetical protein